MPHMGLGGHNYEQRKNDSVADTFITHRSYFVNVKNIYIAFFPPSVSFAFLSRWQLNPTQSICHHNEIHLGSCLMNMQSSFKENTFSLVKRIS